MELDLKKENILLVSGKTKVMILNGVCEVIGKTLSKDSSLIIPEGKRIPILAIEDSEIEVVGDESWRTEEKIERLNYNTIPKEYDDIVMDISTTKNFPKVCVILGEMDTGKTFFTTYIANKLLKNGITVSVIDADTGQSDIGPPGTIGLAILKHPVVFFSEVQPDRLYFVGAHSPSIHMLHSLVGLKKLNDYALKNSDVVLIDTPGWIQGDGARLLRKSEMELINPDKVILMQREGWRGLEGNFGELEHLVKTIPEQKIIRVKVSKKASLTSQTERKRLRELVSQNYFANSRKISLRFSDIVTDRCFFLSGLKLNKEEFGVLWIERLSGFEGLLVVPKSKDDINIIEKIKVKTGINKIKIFFSGDENGVVVGLCNIYNDCIGLGIIENIDFKNEIINIITPIENEKLIKIIQFGSLRLTPDGKEEGFVIPGSF